MSGILVWNGDRPDIVFGNGTLYGGLHCGDCFRCYANEWVDVRLEYTDRWVLVCQEGIVPVRYGAQVQM